MAKKLKHGEKQVKIWSYKVDHPLASASEVAKATNTSYGYVYKLFQSIGTPKEVFEAEAETSEALKPRSYSRGDILDTAKEYVTKDRAADHGDMEDNFQRIAEFWSVHLDQLIDAHDVAVMMTLLKLARIKSNPYHMDNFIDGAGYLACGGELVSK
jgi:hypothetical protein